MSKFSKRLAYDVMYGENSVVLDDDTIEQFLYETKILKESSQVQGVYSDEGLYDYFSGFSDYKKISKSKAAKVMGWPVVDYILSDKAEDPYYQLGMMIDDGSGMKGRADTVSYGGTIQTGDSTLDGGDKKYMKEMEKIIKELGWEIIKWMGIGKERKSKVVIIPTGEVPEGAGLGSMHGKLNECIIVSLKETIKKVDGEYVVYPKKGGTRLGTHSSKKKAMAQLKAIEFSKSKSEVKEASSIEAPGIKKIIAVYPGRFQPFGPHHKEVYDHLKKRFDDVFIATSNKTGGSRHPMSFGEKKKHMQKMGINGSAIKMEKQPYIPKGIMKKYDEDTTAIVFALGEKDEGRLTGGSYFKPYKKNYMRLAGFKKHGYTLKAPHISVRVGGQEISGTTMRKLLGSEKYDVDIKKKFFKKMFGYFDQKIFDLFTSAFKEQVIRKKELLLMGGAYGHMAHPFDDYGLTFGDLKSIIDQGLQGELSKEVSATEKLDGQNIMISVINGKARAARNKGNLKSGGMSLKDVENKFKHHIPNVRDAFVYSMQDLKAVLEKLNKKDQLSFFDNGKNWANLEIIYPSTKNVIDYDAGAQLIFHGILKYDENWVPKGEVKDGGTKIAAAINKINKNIESKFSFGGPNVLNVTKSKDYAKLRSKFFSALNNLKNIYKLKDTDEVSIYHQMFWLEYILAGANSTDFANITDDILYSLMKRWAFRDKSYKMTEINKLKEEHPEFVDWVKTTEKLDHEKMLKANMKPFEALFFELGAEILSNVSNWIAPNPDQTVQNLRKDLDKAAKAIRKTKNPSSLSKLKTQLNKIAAMGDLDKLVPSEGLVFKFKGKTYKFTGFFAPINQITGLMKFAR
jgi:hypothetical protein